MAQKAFTLTDPTIYAVEPDGAIIPRRLARRKAVGEQSPLYTEFFDVRNPGKGRVSSLTRRGGDLGLAYTSAAWAYRCIKIRSDAVAGIRLRLVTDDGDPIDGHPITDLIYHPDNGYDYGSLWRATEAGYQIWGAGYWLKLRRAGPGNEIVTPGGIPLGLQWLNPISMEIKSRPDGSYFFRQTVGARTKDYEPDDIIYFSNFDPLNDLGALSPLGVALNEINAEINAAKYVAAFFANDARPAGMLTSDAQLQDSTIKRVMGWWQRLFGGVSNRWRTGIAGYGLKWQTITFPPEQLALQELRAEDRRAIAAVFGVPPALAGAWEAANYATAREQKASFYEDTIVPQINYYAEVLNMCLLPMYPDLADTGARLEWDIEGIEALQENVDAKNKRIVALFDANLITRDEARAELGLEPIDGDEELFSQDVTSGHSDNPVPPQLMGMQGPQAAQAAQMAQAQANQAQAVKAELKAWERFAMKRANKPTARAFLSTVIPRPLADSIRSDLGAIPASTVGTDRAARIKAIFDGAANTAANMLPIISNPSAGGTVIQPDITDADVDAVLREYRQIWHGILDTDEVIDNGV